MLIRLAVALAAFLAITGDASAGAASAPGSSAEGNSSAAEPAGDDQPAAAGADIAALDWLAGCWSGPSGEECWLEPRAGTMVGVNRGAGGEGAPPVEFLRIVEEDGGLVYLANPGARCPPTPFRAVEVGEARIVFANPEHDFPQRLTYWLDGDGALHARVEAEEDGEMRGFELVWTRGSWSGGGAD